MEHRLDAHVADVGRVRLFLLNQWTQRRMFAPPNIKLLLFDAGRQT